jgi:hypothetical protein
MQKQKLDVEFVTEINSKTLPFSKQFPCNKTNKYAE